MDRLAIDLNKNVLDIPSSNQYITIISWAKWMFMHWINITKVRIWLASTKKIHVIVTLIPYYSLAIHRWNQYNAPAHIDNTCGVSNRWWYTLDGTVGNHFRICYLINNPMNCIHRCRPHTSGLVVSAFKGLCAIGLLVDLGPLHSKQIECICLSDMQYL